MEEMLAGLDGEDIAHARKAQEQRAEIWTEAQQYIDLPAEHWPPLNFNWDKRAESQRFALDGKKEAEFKAIYPAGLRLGWVELSRFDPNLCHFSRRDTPEELWKLGSSTKLAEVIAYIVRGLPISPPLVMPHPTQKNELLLGGGHHRYAAAKFSGQISLPILVAPEHCEAVGSIVPVSWAAPPQTSPASST